MKPKKVAGLAFILIGLGLIVWTGLQGWVRQANSAVDEEMPLANQTDLATPLWQAEPLVPTAAPVQTSVKGPTLTAIPSFSQSVASLSAEFLFDGLPANPVERFGVGVPFPPFEGQAAEALTLGWYLSWRVAEAPAKPNGLEFWQMIRVGEEGFRPDEATLRQIAAANPGTTWLIGNEPDVIWQDNVTPERYAELYHELYHLLKGSDPKNQIAIGGVTQPTPLRLQYLEMILASYEQQFGEPMPVDIWNIHNFILPEVRDSWGVDIPPGLTAEQGVLYGIDDHDDLEIFKAQLVAFRQWMADNGRRDKPLIVSEYGILMPEDYGFGPERMQRFLYGTYEIMLTATDEKLGYPADDHRLVQRWAWYSLSDNRYATGNLIDFTTGDLTKLGQAHQQFVANLVAAE